LRPRERSPRRAREVPDEALHLGARPEHGFENADRACARLVALRRLQDEVRAHRDGRERGAKIVTDRRQQRIASLLHGRVDHLLRIRRDLGRSRLGSLRRPSWCSNLCVSRAPRTCARSLRGVPAGVRSIGHCGPSNVRRRARMSMRSEDARHLVAETSAGHPMLFGTSARSRASSSARRRRSSSMRS
jgi:hypothetical protein